jgi:NAD(P)-dependent dehydrogenase (short-subunit alcohol dehydrogenase family)
MLKRRKVEVLAVYPDPIRTDQVAHKVGEPLSAYRVGQVEQAREKVVPTLYVVGVGSRLG